MRYLTICVSKKLKEQAGVTIVFALAVFMIACLLSMVIVNAAINNANRIRRQSDEQQAMLAVSSAAGYVQTLFDGVSAVYEKPKDAAGKWQEPDYGTSGLAEQKSDAGSGGSAYMDSDADNRQQLFEDFLKNYSPDFSGDEPVLKVNAGAEGTFCWTIGVADDTYKSLDVVLDGKLEENDLIVTLTKADADTSALNSSASNESGDYSMTLVFSGSAFADNDGDNAIAEYKWDFKSIDR